MELAVLIGLQASGKSTFVRSYFADSCVAISKDAWPNARRRQQRQMRLLDEALAAGRDVVVDNTNPGPAAWHPLIEAGHRHGARVVAYWFAPDLARSLARNAARHKPVPDVGVFTTAALLRRPYYADGFDDICQVRFDGRGGFVVEPLADLVEPAREKLIQPDGVGHVFPGLTPPPSGGQQVDHRDGGQDQRDDQNEHRHEQ